MTTGEDLPNFGMCQPRTKIIRVFVLAALDKGEVLEAVQLGPVNTVRIKADTHQIWIERQFWELQVTLVKAG